MSDLDAVRRFALSPNSGMMYEAERGGWVRHGDMAATIERLTAERDAARANAKRYEWLKSRFDELRDGWALEVCVEGAPSLETLDDAIDAAIGR